LSPPPALAIVSAISCKSRVVKWTNGTIHLMQKTLVRFLVLRLDVIWIQRVQSKANQNDSSPAVKEPKTLDPNGQQSYYVA
jgi:hypothetical protein